MTKNKTAICTPTATRADFESILRELDGVGVKWGVLGDRPASRLMFYDSDIKFLVYSDKYLHWGFESTDCQLPRAKFISAIKRDFARECEHEWRFNCCVKCGVDDVVTPGTRPKEQPKMNYKKMTKAELIGELKKNNKFVEKQKDYIHNILRDMNLAIDEKNSALENWDKDRKYLKSTIITLKKTNAEQAETIEVQKHNMEKFQEQYGELNSLNIQTEIVLRQMGEENTRIKRLAAQILCADVLEGK